MGQVLGHFGSTPAGQRRSCGTRQATSGGGDLGSHTRREKCLGAPLRGASASVWVVTQRLRHLRTCRSTLAHLRRNLLVATLGMLRRVQNDPRTHGLGLRRFVSADELMKLFDFFCRQFYWISGSGTSHWHHLPDPV